MIVMLTIATNTCYVSGREWKQLIDGIPERAHTVGHVEHITSHHHADRNRDPNGGLCIEDDNSAIRTPIDRPVPACGALDHNCANLLAVSPAEWCHERNSARATLCDCALNNRRVPGSGCACACMVSVGGTVYWSAYVLRCCLLLPQGKTEQGWILSDVVHTERQSLCVLICCDHRDIGEALQQERG